MNHSQLRKYSNQWVKIRPAAAQYNGGSGTLSPIEDDWLLCDITDSSATLRNNLGHIVPLGLDQIHHYTSDLPAGERRGILVLNVQLIYCHGELKVEPTTRPGIALESYRPIPTRETLISHARRLHQQQELEARRNAYEGSIEAIRAAQVAFEELERVFGETSREVAAETSQVAPQITRQRNVFVVRLLGNGASVSWSQPYQNTLRGALLTVTIWEGNPTLPGEYSLSQPTAVAEYSYTFGLADSGQPAWLPQFAEPSLGHSAHEIANNAFTDLFQTPPPQPFSWLMR
jgi:hypothetical protein